MKQLSKLQSVTMGIGAVLMLAGAVLAAVLPALAPWLFAVGALAFTAMQMQQRYDGDNFTIQRLRRIVIMSDILLILTAALMFADYGNSFGLDHYTWLNYVHNNWIVVLLIAAVIQIYTVYRIDSELQKQ